MHGLADEFADFQGQPPQGQSSRWFIGTIIDEEDTGAGHEG
jgi:hypothetical protein